MTDELETQIRAAMEQHSGGGDDAAGVEHDSPSGGGTADSDAGAPTGAPVDATGADGDGAESEDSARRPQGRSRDATGKYAKASKAVAPKVTQKAAPPVGGTIPNAGEAVQPVAPKYKAPQSWRPELREKFSTLPPELQEEVDKREKEIAFNIRKSGHLEGFQQQWHRTLAPYEAMLRSHGPDPMQAVSNALQQIHQLHNGPPQVRAKALAELIDQSGISPDLINAHWSGQPVAQTPQDGGFDPRAFADQLKQEWRQEQQEARNAHLRQQATQDVAAFAAENEFFEDLRPMIGALVNTGVELKQAYEQACWASPEHRKILQQREAASQAKASNASTQRNRAAAVSLKTRPAAAPESEAGDDLDSQIRAAMKAHRRA